MKTLNIGFATMSLLLAGCGGEDFTSGGSLGDEGDAGPEGAGGAVTGTAGGVTGVTGGSGGAVPGTGGTAAGGQGAGSGGAGGLEPGTGGAAAGGQPGGSGSALAGGGAGAGGAPPVCNPPKITPENLPQEFTWESYDNRLEMIPADMCLSCRQSPCATCALTWWPVTQSADGLTLTATADGTCGPVDVSLVACGSEPSTCTTWGRARYISSTLVFSLQPKADGSGYTLIYRTNTDTGGLTYPPGGACPDEAYRGMITANQPMWPLFFALRDAVTATEWPCGG